MTLVIHPVNRSDIQAVDMRHMTLSSGMPVTFAPGVTAILGGGISLQNNTSNAIIVPSGLLGSEDPYELVALGLTLIWIE